MDFGRLPERELGLVDFSLPEEPQWNEQILTGKGKTAPRVYVGGIRWACKEWIGKIYPNGTKDFRLLDEYIKNFNAIELNATHYKLYNPAAITEWKEKAAGTDFVFCPKVYQGISHVGPLNETQFLTDTFLKGVTAFGEHLGPIFLQMSDKFGPRRKEELSQYLQSLPTDLSFFVELRHFGWFDVPHLNELLVMLKQNNVGLIITDGPSRRDCCHMHLTQTKAFIRFVANNLHPSDYSRIDEWVQRIKYWLDNGLTELYFFIHMQDETLAPELVTYLVDKLNNSCNLKLKKPTFVAPSLFS